MPTKKTSPKKKVPARKKAPAKKAPSKKTVAKVAVAMTKPSSGKMPKTYNAHSARGSIYKDIFERMNALKPGQHFEVKTPKGVDVKIFHGRLNAAQRNQGAKVKAPKGYIFRKNTLENRTGLCILLEKAKK